MLDNFFTSLTEKWPEWSFKHLRLIVDSKRHEDSVFLNVSILLNRCRPPSAKTPSHRHAGSRPDKYTCMHTHKCKLNGRHVHVHTCRQKRAHKSILWWSHFCDLTGTHTFTSVKGFHVLLSQWGLSGLRWYGNLCQRGCLLWLHSHAQP